MQSDCIPAKARKAARGHGMSDSRSSDQLTMKMLFKILRLGAGARGLVLVLRRGKGLDAAT